MLPNKQMSPIISVSNPLLITEPLNTKVSYIVKTEDSSGVYECTRLYNEFVRMRKILTKKWPGIYIPPIPSKSFFSNFSSKYVKTYKKQIEFFLNYLTNYEFFYQNPDFQNFLKSKTAFKAKPVYDLNEASLNYQAVFHEYSGKPLTDEISGKIKKEEEFFLRSLSRIVDLRDRAEILASEFKDFHEILAATTNLLGKIEHSQIFTPESPDIFTSPNMASIKNAYNEVYFWAESEILEIEAMLESIAFAKQLQQDVDKLLASVNYYNAEIEKIENRQMTIGKFFSFKNHEKYMDSIMQKKADKENELMDLKNFLTIVVFRLIEKDIPVFKEIRAEIYAHMSGKYNDITEKASEVFCDSAKQTLRNLKKARKDSKA